MRKRIAMALLAGTMMISCAASAAAAESGFANPGTYSATAAGRNGDVTVTATFTENEISDIQVDSAETDSIGVAAIDQLIAQILSSQGLGVDAVAGATLSSDAFMKALKECIEQAGGDVEALEAVKAAGEEAEAAEYVTDADVIVIGAGGAGLTAAVTAAKEGASVVVLEKSGVIGGNSLCSQMGINAADSKVTEELGMEYATSELLKSLQMRYDGRENLVDAYVENSGRTVDWFADEFGVEFMFDTHEGQGGPMGEGPAEDETENPDPLANVNDDHPSGDGLFMVKANADGFTSNTLVNVLSEAAAELNVNIYVNTEATALVTDENGNVTGVKAVAADGSEIEFAGKAVLLATGGFGKNHEMVVSVRPDLENAITDEMAPTTGDGIVMAEAVGAKLVDMEYMQLFPHVPYGDTWLPPMAMPGGFMTTALFVNQDAQRYTTEGFDSSTPGTLEQEKAFVIFGEEDLNDDLKRLEGRGIVVSGDTAEELAEALGLDGAALQATIDQWNADCEAGADSQFEHQNLKPVAGKLYGYRFGVGAHYMMGGVLINEKTQVLDENEEVIGGLYAAGEVTGGFHGKVRVDGSGTGDAFVFGHLAGTVIAEAAAE